MNGPDHYQHAEELLDHVSECLCEGKCEQCAWRISKAQAHATLALAAAAAIQPAGESAPNRDWDTWLDVAGVPKPQAVSKQ